MATEHSMSLVWSVIWWLPGNACPLLVHQPRPLMYTIWLPTIQNKRACCWPIQISLHLPVVWLLSESNRQHKKHTHLRTHKVHMTTDYSARGVYRVTWLLTPVNEPNAMEIKWRFVWCLLLCHNAFSPLIKKPFHCRERPALCYIYVPWSNRRDMGMYPVHVCVFKNYAYELYIALCGLDEAISF